MLFPDGESSIPLAREVDDNEEKMKKLSKKAKSCVDGQPIGRTHLPPQSTSVGDSIPNLGTINQLGDPSSLDSPPHDPPMLPTTQDDTSTLANKQGLTKEIHLRVHDAWALPPGQRVVVPWNNIGQPIGEGRGLLAIFLGTVAMNFTLFPISYAMWSTMPNVYKNEVYKNIVQEIEKGAPVSRGDVRSTTTHKRRDGSFVNDKARLISLYLFLTSHLLEV
ncbi:hypothetical protein G2W53_022205 [Senna tora]|uniref:Uncharacterized protein n=1 Tax=Senna tora TaxID=362788 RepID=A0A834WLV2_9FABA|nr:hypothetical protein G2W53_022205 [Senna tora]